MRAAILVLMTLLAPGGLFAGGPRYVAGTSYFDPAVIGQPVHWRSGIVNYYVDQGALNSQIDNRQAIAMVDAAASLWSNVSTAAVALTNSGPLAEDIVSSGVVPGTRAFGNPTFSRPYDVAPSASGYPIAVIFDEDGGILETLFGAGSADPASCQNDGVFAWLDGIRTDATVSHAVIVLNGRCATNAGLVAMMQYQLTRAFGRILGLDYAQVNHGTSANGQPNAAFAWPFMDPLSGVCGSSGGTCIPDPSHLRYDDVSALNRLYPITPANLAQFPGKRVTSENTISIRGAVNFRNGTGMQGVNVVARPLDLNGNPLYEYTVSAVSGALFRGKHGNPVTGSVDADGNPLSMWGSEDLALQGSFDLSGVPLPPGTASASYQISFESIRPLYMLANSVGPYVDSSPMPSGTLQSFTLQAVSSGSMRTLIATIPDSASGNLQDAIAAPENPRQLAPSGMWCGRLGQIGQTDWFTFPVRTGHTFTIVTQALGESEDPTGTKALPVIGVWDAMSPVSTPPLGWAPPLNGFATGETWLMVTANADELIRVAISDLRGDGRPDYTYKGWVLYAESVFPERLPKSGGPIVIHGMGFRPSGTVRIGGQKATVTSISPTEITVIAPAAPSGITGSVDIEVDDLPSLSASTTISGGISYDTSDGDSLTLNNAPAGTIPIGVPIPFTVTALSSALVPAGGVAVTFSVVSGSARLGCGTASCSIAASGDGIASMSVTAPAAGPSVVIASLSNGSSLQAHFSGGTPPTLFALEPRLSIAAGAVVEWTTQVIALSNGSPAAGQSITWQTSRIINGRGSTTAMTSEKGIAGKTLTIGPLERGQQVTFSACLNGTGQCVDFTVLGARPEYAYLEPISGTLQNLPVKGTPDQVLLRLRDMNGNPMAGGTVTFYQALYAWATPCPPRGLCSQTPLLATQTSNATSTVDGVVSFVPASIPGVPTSLTGLATSGTFSTQTINVERYP